PVSVSGRFSCEQAQSRLGQASSVQLSGQLSTPPGIALAAPPNPALGWWTNLQPFAFNWNCHLLDLRSRKINVDKVTLGGTWQAPQLTVSNLEATLYDGQLAAFGELDVATRAAHVSLSSDFDPHTLASLLPAEANRWLAQFSWTKPPQ